MTSSSKYCSTCGTVCRCLLDDAYLYLYNKSSHFLNSISEITWLLLSLVDVKKVVRFAVSFVWSILYLWFHARYMVFRTLKLWLYLKVKCSRSRPGVVQRVGRGIALLFHDRGTRRGWVVNTTLRPHFTPGKEPVPILQEVRWAPGPVWTGGKSRLHRDSIPGSFSP